MLGHVEQPYRAPTPLSIARILVATDFEHGAADPVVHVAATLARSMRAALHVLCVLEALMYTPKDMASFVEREPARAHPEASRKMTELVHRLRALGLENTTHSIEFGIPVDVIERRTEEGRFDLVVLGTGRRAASATHLMTRLKVPVLAVPSSV
jgi:nucleotide-binding universal stress UspA family protein